MQTPDSQIISNRFFTALDTLIDNKVIRGVQTFTRKYDINRWNFCRLRTTPSSDMFQTAWLFYLVRDFMISPRWLLTGEGDMFEPGWDAERVRNIHKLQRDLEKKLNAPKRRGRPRKVQDPQIPLTDDTD